jgi:hypothetical protein
MDSMRRTCGSATMKVQERLPMGLLPRLPRHLSFAGLVSVVITCSVACSGARPQDVLGDEVAQSSSSSGSGGGSSSSGNGSSGVTSSGGTSGGGGGGSSGLPAGCTPEQEPNDTRDTANELAPSRCGTVGKRDRSDFFTFVLKPTTKTFSLNFSGDVHLRVDVNGSTVDLFPNTTSTFPPFAPGKRYVIEVQPLDINAAEVKYSVELVEQS